MILTILALLVGVAWLMAVAIPSLMAAHVETGVAVLHRQISLTGSWASRVVPARWVNSVSEVPLIALLAGLLILGTWAFFGILEDVMMGDPITGLDKRIFSSLQGLRTPLIDQMMVFVTGLGDHKVVMPVVLTGLVVMAVLQRWRAAWYLLLAVVGAAVFVGGVKRVIHRPRPISLYDGLAEYSFPSGHATMSVVLYGFLAFLLTYAAPPRWRRAVCFVALAVILLIAFSRIYLGAHWLSDVLAGLAFGVAWVAVLALFYVRVEPQPLPAAAVGTMLVAVMIAASAVHAVRDAESHRYAPTGPPLAAPAR